MRIIYLFTLFAFGNLFAQTVSLPGYQDGMTLAIENAKKGNYKLYSFGLRIIDDEQFDEYYDDFLLKTYKISMDDMGCVIGEYEKCYNDKMYELILKKWGNDIFEKTRAEAEDLYKNEIRSNPDSNIVYNYVDRFPEFDGGKDSLNAFLQRNISYPMIKDTIYGKVYIGFVVNQQGELEDLKILKTFSKTYSEVVMNAMIKSPRWKPGTYFGRKVKVRMNLPVYFKHR